MRNVIVLDPTLKIDEVDFSYKSFIIEFSGLIIKRIVKDKGWTIVKASNFLKARFKYDDYIYSIIQDIIREEEPKVIINRNPTLNVGSILLMKIRKVKPDAEDYTLSIPSAILPGLTNKSGIGSWVNKPIELLELSYGITSSEACA